jgi:hypothetical protein
MAVEFTPYSTGESLFGTKPSWVADPLDQKRLMSYALYEMIYWNVPEVFRLTQRGTDDKPIYVPAGRTIIDTSNRYTAPGYSVAVSNLTGGPDSADVQAARMTLSDLMARERFKSKFRGAKRYCQIQGDWIWHVTANPEKPVGTRLSMTVVDPGHYFPVQDPENVDRVIAVFLAELVTQGNDQFVRRVCYRKMAATATAPAQIFVEEGLFEVDNWQDLDVQPEEVIRPLTQLPPEITAIPVYHTKNFEEPGNPFGSSEIRGMERIISGLHQTMSDEDLTLALNGLGMYVTDAPRPVDPETKRPVAWQLGPGRVVQVPTANPPHKFERVSGVSDVTPYGDHYTRLWDAIKQATGSPDVAIGTVDVAIAQSGIALALQLSPIVAKSSEKNDLIAESHDQMWFDITNMWYPAYEETTFTEVKTESVFADAVPVDRETRFKELNDMLAAGVIDDQYYRDEATKLGYKFPENMATRAATWRQAQQPVDPFATRVDAETAEDDGPA